MPTVTPELNFKEDVKINRFKLDDAAEKQASIYMNWAEELADAKAHRDKAKNRLDYQLGKKELAFRKTPPDGVKITEGTIKALLATDTDIREIKKEVQEAEKEVYILDGAIRALDHKKAMIDNLRYLWVSGYYSTPGGKVLTDDTDRERNKNLNKNRKDKTETKPFK